MLSQEKRLIIITEQSHGIDELRLGLVRRGFASVIASANGESIKKIVEQAPDLVLMTVNGHLTNSRVQELAQKIKRERPLPIVALVSKEAFNSLDVDSQVIDDFSVTPGDLNELVLRIKRLLQKSGDTDTGELIRCGDLLIDLAKCEVSIGGRPVELAFKEYELLRFLAANPGRVFKRDTLLNKVWGYDYYGGDRTVDVHVRRLRSKIEDASHTFIETVRNIGYRFKCDS
jgi:two-component system alkaline phosphatase synthesis response regulator PhoP